MSDIQIITGISILISGGTQLKCGLSCYQWQMLVYLAWFSSLTHLSSLTLLRNYLHNRPAERGWRLFFMFVLVVLLIFAFIPTANYRWQYGYGWDETGVPTVADYAICYLKPVFRPNPPSQFFIDASLSEQSIMAMSISILLLFIGFICRVFKLHQSFSVFVDESIRGRLSHFLRMLLRAVYDWCDIRGSPRSLKRTLLYRPLLAVFLTLRVVLDTWNSMFFEVWCHPTDF